MTVRKNNAPLNVALIGQKFMGRAHANAWGQAGRFFDLPMTPHLHTIAAKDASTLPAFAAKWNWANWTDDWRTLAENDGIDLVDIGTPNHLHAEQSIAMLEAGKHVACEKPLARNVEEAKAMRDAAAKARGMTFVWFNYRRCPAIAFAYRLIRDGRLGRIYHVRARYLQSWGGPETPMSWRFRKETAGSGAHGDLNAHIVDLARFLTGEEISDIHGAVARTFIEDRIPGTAARGKSNVDDAVLFLASLTSGAVASFEATRLATGHHNNNTIEINGEQGAIRFAFERMNELWFYDADDRPGGAAGVDGWKRIMCTHAGAHPKGHPYVENWWPDGHVLGYEHGFVNMAADIVRAVNGGEPDVPLPDFADAYETQRVLDAALIAAENRCAVSLTEVV